MLAFYGHGLSDEDAIEACGTESVGSLADVAVQGLADLGLDAEVQRFEGVEDLRDLLSEGRPAIVFLWHLSGALHAVVVCEVTDAAVTVMDPAVGELVRMPLAHFEALWYNRDGGGMVVGRATAE